MRWQKVEENNKEKLNNNLKTLTSKPASKGGDFPGWYRPAEWFMSVALIPTYLN